ncbi:MAG: riboflavin synthase [Deferribacteraceae bacterium]|jgi:riboflavin synthase|nr:riboflavin synthase [Deferribacteraceae bacterium]
MFTGIIEELGVIKKIASNGSISIGANVVTEGLLLGDSVAVNGVCLTVTTFSPAHFEAFISAETFQRSTFKILKAGSKVNLERALTLNSRLGGHIVQGHVDVSGRVISFTKDGTLTVSAPHSIRKYLAEKGSVTIDGISLTVSTLTEDSFSVAVIPHTRETTNLSAVRAGDLVNIEVDIIARYVQRLMTSEDSGKHILELLSELKV